MDEFLVHLRELNLDAIEKRQEGIFKEGGQERKRREEF